MSGIVVLAVVLTGLVMKHVIPGLISIPPGMPATGPPTGPYTVTFSHYYTIIAIARQQ